MSDMEQSDVVPEVPAADVVAPAEPPAPEQPAETPADAPVDAPALEAVPVLAQAASSEKQTPEADEAEDETPVSLEDAARAVVLFVRAHRTIGDADLAAAIADVEAALPAQA